MSTETLHLGASTRVAACAGGGRIRIETRPLPSPGPGEVLLELRAAGLCGTDLFKLAHEAAVPGTVLGHEIVGVVEGIGPGVQGFSPGDRVVVPHHVACGVCPLCLRRSETLCPAFRENLMEPGGFSEHVLIRERAVRLGARKIPPGVSDEAAVFLEPAACVLRGVHKAELPPAEAAPCVVAVIGAGSMGLLHLLVLRAVAPHVDVIVSDTREDRLQIASSLGAAAALHPGEAGVEAAVRLRTEGLGADAVFDTVGGGHPLEAALGMTREGGTVVLFAHAPEGDRASFDLNRFFKVERRVLGTYSSGLAEQDDIWTLIASGRLDASPIVTHRLPLSRIEEGIELCRRLAALKVLLLPEEEGLP